MPLMALHLREAAEVDVGAGLLHLHHLAEALFHLLHVALGRLWVDDVFEALAVFFLYSVWRYAEAVALEQVGHYLVLYLACVALGAEAVEHLYLEFHQLFPCRWVGCDVGGHVALFGEHAAPFVAQGHGPAHECALPHLLVGGAAVDLGKEAQFVYVEQVHRAERQGRHHQLLVVGIHRGRGEYACQLVGGAVGELGRRPEIVEHVVYELLVGAEYFLLAPASGWLRLEFKHGRVGDEAF